MKKIFGIIFCVLLISLCAFALADTEINETNFPDRAFRDYVRQFDTDRNGSFSDGELAGVKTIEVIEAGISSLKGVEYFTALTELRCPVNELAKLDISQNTALTYLDCGYNQLTSLDVSRNTALEELWCGWNQLPSLVLSGNSALRELYCFNNQLTELDVSSNTALTELICDGNQLASLHLSRNTALAFLQCCSNQLTALDVSKNTALTFLRCDSNRLAKLDVSKNTALTLLWCGNNRLTELDVSQNTALERLGCDGNKLASLDISQCPELLKIVQGSEPAAFTMSGMEYFGWREDPDDPYAHAHLLIDRGLEVLTDHEIPVSKIKLNKTKATLTRTSAKKKPTLQLKATVTPGDAADPSVEWKSSNPKIAKVDQNGKVTALKAGKVTITCTAKDGSGVRATCKITVKDQPVTGLALNRKTLSLKKGKTFRLKVTIKPEGALNKKVRWTSSDKTVATVDQNGKVKASGKGTCVITCKALDGSGKEITCRITVK